MKPIRLLLAAGAIALACSPAMLLWSDFANATDMQFGGVTIPSQQTLSPATHDDIAFRPACSQLVPIQREDWVFWTVTLSDGEQRTLQTFPPMPTEDAYLYLDAHGLCKLGGVNVPLVYTSQVPQRQVAQFTVTPTGGDISPAGQNVPTVTPQPPQETSMPLWAIAAGGVVLIGCAVGFVALVRSGDKRKATPKPQQPKQTASAADALSQIFGGDNNA